MPTLNVFFDNKRGVSVTERTFSTPLKDEDIAHIRSVKIGREPLYLAVTLSVLLILATVRFNGLLYPHEQMTIIGLCVVLIGAGYSIASLTIGTLFNDKTLFWFDYWTIRSVRIAIRNAKHVNDEKRTVTKAIERS